MKYLWLRTQESNRKEKVDCLHVPDDSTPSANRHCRRLPQMPGQTRRLWPPLPLRIIACMMWVGRGGVASPRYTTVNTKPIGINLGDDVKTGSNTPRCIIVEMTMRYLSFFLSEKKRHAGYDVSLWKKPLWSRFVRAIGPGAEPGSITRDQWRSRFQHEPGPIGLHVGARAARGAWVIGPGS
jgi:hypothetical protein